MNRHQPVMVREVLAGLQVAAGKIFLDATVGYGGHAAAILQASAPDGRLIGIDRDPEAIAASQKRLLEFGERVVLAQANYTELGKILNRQAISVVDGIFLDLGVSSPQLESAARGFSLKQSGPLDMRMDPQEKLTATAIINRWSVTALEKIFREYGEERFARRYARAIVQHRPLRTTAELASVIQSVAPRSRSRRIDPATRVFQALRIVVNRELECLEAFLNQTEAALAPGGHLCVLSYHSLEDRRVKEFFRQGEREGSWKILTKKPLRPTPEECADNPRARSAKLRVGEKRAKT